MTLLSVRGHNIVLSYKGRGGGGRKTFTYIPLWVCKPAYLVPVPSQDKWDGSVRKGIRRENGGDGEVGAPISLDEVAVYLDSWCICLCYLQFAPENPE